MRLRLGELLIQCGLLTPEQVAEGLQVQVAWGGRLGTVLNELGYLDLDTLSRVLGWQHALPAALLKHFEFADRDLQHSLESDLAEQFSCIPLLRVRRRIIVASTSPLDERATAIVASQLGASPDLIIPAIAAELRIRYQLEHVYMISRPHRFLRVRGTETSPRVRSRVPAAVVPSIDLPGEVAQRFAERSLEAPAEPTPAERRTYLTTIDESDGVVQQSPSEPAPRVSRPATRADSHETRLRALRCAIDRSDVAELVIEAVAEHVVASRAAALLVVRGQAATTWASFRRDRELEPIAISLERPGLARTALKRTSGLRVAAGDLTDSDYRLLIALDPDAGDLIITPIIADKSVVALLVVSVAPGASADGLDDITAATGFALVRLMREVSQPTPSRPHIA